MLTADQVRKVLRNACAEAGSKAAFARQHNLAPSLIGEFLNGNFKQPTPQLMSALNIRREIRYARNKPIID